MVNQKKAATFYLSAQLIFFCKMLFVLFYIMRYMIDIVIKLALLSINIKYYIFNNLYVSENCIKGFNYCGVQVYFKLIYWSCLLCLEDCLNIRSVSTPFVFVPSSLQSIQNEDLLSNYFH